MVHAPWLFRTYDTYQPRVSGGEAVGRSMAFTQY